MKNSVIAVGALVFALSACATEELEPEVHFDGFDPYKLEISGDGFAAEFEAVECDVDFCIVMARGTAPGIEVFSVGKEEESSSEFVYYFPEEDIRYVIQYDENYKNEGEGYVEKNGRVLTTFAYVLYGVI